MRHLLAACVVAALPVAVASAAVFNDYRPVLHDRFVDGDPSRPNRSFIGSTHDLTGVGIGGRGAILITPQHYITAEHFKTNSPRFLGSDGVVRQPGRDTSFGSNGFVTVTTTFDPDGPNGAEPERTQGSDITIGKLASPLPMDQFTPFTLADATAEFLAGCEVLVFDQFDRAQRNFIDETFLTAFGDGNGGLRNPTVVNSFDVTPGAADEAFLQGGDSGHAMLLRTEGQVFALGTNFGIFDASEDDDPDTTIDVNFSSYLGPYVDQIQAIIDGDNASSGTSYDLNVRRFETVPEPATLALLGLTPLLLARRRAG